MRSRPISAKPRPIRRGGHWSKRPASASRRCKSTSPPCFPPISASHWGSTVSMATDLKIDRRGLFYAGFGALIGGSLGLSRDDARAAPQWPGASFVTAARIDGIDCGALFLDATVTSIALSARAHCPVLMRDAGASLLVGRRPGTFAAVVDLEAPEATPRLFDPIQGHRFAGHAAIKGDALFTTEIDAETGDGAAVLRDARSFEPRARYAVGIEPHDVLFARGGDVVVVAVGGIARAAEIKGPAI